MPGWDIRMSFIDAFFHKNRPATALSLILAAAMAVGAPAARAADAAAATAAPTPATAQTPFTYKVLRAQTVVQPDGTSETLEHYEIQVNNDEAARTFHSFPIAFDASREETELVEAYTIKKDGRKIPVDPAGVFVQMPQGGADTPMFDNMRQRMVVYPDLAAGDTIVYIGKRRETKPLMDGQYFRSAYYDRHQSFEDVRVEISLPRDKPLYVETRGVTATQADQGDRIVHTLTYSAPQALLDDNSAVSGFDRLPGYLVSTVPDYTALVRQYAGMIAAPTATVRAKAEEITRGIRDRRAQAAALHAWVAAHIRYIGIEIGEGGLVPHPVDTILANGYGDCKDHAALYAALLKAKGIDADFVLINAGNAYKTAEHGSLTPFNHAISYIPEFGLYDDTTAATAPFGVLPIQEYGKPVVHVALDGGLPKGDVLHHTPLLPPGGASSDTRVTATLTADGAISGQGTATATGAFSIGLRAIGQGIAASGPQRFAEDYLKRINLTGGMTLDADPPHRFQQTRPLQHPPDLPFRRPPGTGGRRVLPPAGRLPRPAPAGRRADGLSGQHQAEGQRTHPLLQRPSGGRPVPDHPGGHPRRPPARQRHHRNPQPALCLHLEPDRAGGHPPHGIHQHHRHRPVPGRSPAGNRQSPEKNPGRPPQGHRRGGGLRGAAFRLATLPKNVAVLAE